MAVIRYKNDEADILNHMALVQAFELVFELAWKVLKDYIAEKEIKVYYPKEVIKEAFNHETITNGELWISMLETRNSTAHEYKMDKVASMLESIADLYFNELSSFKVFVEMNIEK